jgi:heptosyltransferase-2
MSPLFRLAGLGRGPTGPGLRDVRRVLVVRLDKIGDVVLFAPFLRELRRCLPRARIVVAAGPAGFDLLAPCPHVDEVLLYDPRGRTRFWRLLRHGRAIALGARRLWRERFDLAICGRHGRDESHAVALAYASGAPRRVAWSEHVAGGADAPYPDLADLVTETLDSGEPRHEVERNLEMLRRLGGAVEDDRIELWWTEEDERRAGQALAAAGRREPFAAVAPGALAPKRRWPADRFAAVADRLAEDGLGIVLVGGPGEQSLAAEVRAAMRQPATDLTGTLSIRESGRVLARAAVLVGNDSGPAHVAAAAGTPVVAVWWTPESGDPDHASAPGRFGPRGPSVRTVLPEAPRAPCGDACASDAPHCILNVPVERVLAAVSEVRPRPA